MVTDIMHIIGAEDYAQCSIDFYNAWSDEAACMMSTARYPIVHTLIENEEQFDAIAILYWR